MKTSIEMIELYKREFLLNKVCYNGQPHRNGHKKRYTHTYKKGFNNIAATTLIGNKSVKSGTGMEWNVALKSIYILLERLKKYKLDMTRNFLVVASSTHAATSLTCRLI